jgi:hypothetical protein
VRFVILATPFRDDKVCPFVKIRLMGKSIILCFALLGFLVAAPSPAYAIGCDTVGCPKCQFCDLNTHTCTAVTCNSPGGCQKLPGTCNTTSGACEYPADVGKVCNDGNSCTKNDACNASATCAGTAYTCTIPPAPDNVCWTSSTCDGAGGCNNVFKANTTACDKDGDACTVADHCNGSGTCVAGAPQTCSTPPNTQCYVATGACQSPGGTCSYTKKTGSCNDADACTYQDTCQADGTCKGLAGRSCAATAECPIAGTCDGNGGCTPPADRDTKGNCSGKSAGDACSTCNPCIQNQTCNASGDCVGAPVTNGVPCSVEACPNGMCMAGSCTCMSTPQPDLAFEIVDMSMDPGSGGGGGTAGGGSGGGGGGAAGGGKGGCAMATAGAPAPRDLILIVALMLFFFSVRRRLRRAHA